MSRLIIVGGASGAGKSFLLQNIALLDLTVVVVRKLTTRKPRPYESASGPVEDLELSTPLASVKQCDYVYQYGKDWYGARRQDIKQVLLAGKNPILIVRNCRTIHKILHDFPGALVVYLQSGLSGDDLKEKLLEQGRQDIDIDERMRRNLADFNEYVRHIYLFRHVLINFFDDLLLDQMQAILQYEITDDDILPDFVFVLMSFNPDFTSVYKAMCAAGMLVKGRTLRVERIDAKLGDYKITNEVLRSIRRSALILCEVSEERPNVYYELGYARGLGKTVIPCARAGTTLPFDVKDFRTIFYSDPIDLQEKLVAEFIAAFNGSEK